MTLIGRNRVDPARTAYESFVPDSRDRGMLQWVGGDITPKHPTTTEKKDVFFDEFTSGELRDCSDSRYRCLYGLYRVFAVPREGLKPQSTYRVDGAVFRVEKCLRGDERRCQAALISSDCQSKLAPDRCAESSGDDGNGAARGPVGYFIFNEDFGITSYGALKQRGPTEEARMSAALDLVLRGEKGLLAND